MSLPTLGLFELVLEVADLPRSEHFYHEIIGLPIADRWAGERRATFLTLGREGFLGLWPAETGGARAIHGGRGGAHVHFAVLAPPGSLPEFEARLHAHGYETERQEFGPGNLALYVTDPDGHVLELTERATLWDGAPARAPEVGTAGG
ncbi:MAG: VOC family protein [Thermomicrobiales bacterium]|nr:VOC family protein [Thermomicrobiales bacterium]